MAYTTAQLQSLEDALARGERQVTFQDRTVVYRTVDEMKVAIREVKRGLIDSEDPKISNTCRQIRVVTNKGF